MSPSLRKPALSKFGLAVLAVLIGLPVIAQNAAQTLTQARAGHKTKLTKSLKDTERMVQPPPSLFQKVQYKSPAGSMEAMLSLPQDKSKKYPAILWITGGFPSGGIGESAWKYRAPSNDQSAKIYRQRGLIMMYPSFRGASGNPGQQEGFYGEVDDVVAAFKYLKSRSYVDSKRIFIGGHSTGGTLALLVAGTGLECRAILSFGPVDDLAGYGQEVLPFDLENAKETKLRAPIHYLEAIQSPTFVIEGLEGGNVEPLKAMKKVNKNSLVKFMTVRGASHFNILAPINDFIAKRIVGLKGSDALSFSAQDLQKAFDEAEATERESKDLRTLSQIRAAGVNLRQALVTQHYLYGRDKAALNKVAEGAKAGGFAVKTLKSQKDRNGREYFVLIVTKTANLMNLSEVFALSKAMAGLSKTHKVQYDGWDIQQ